MYRHIGRYFIALAVALVTLGAAPVFANDGCEAGKSLFLNISNERPGNVQIALVVAYANAKDEIPEDPTPPDSGQAAETQLFFSNAAASYAINTSPGILTKKQLKRLDKYLRKEFGYRLEDVVRIQGLEENLNGGMPDIRTLQEVYGSKVFACSICVAEALTAAGIEGIDPTNPETFMAYLIPDALPMSPSGFYRIYDRVEGEGADCRDITATVISF
jgi:hypothetical protein